MCCVYDRVLRSKSERIKRVAFRRLRFRNTSRKGLIFYFKKLDDEQKFALTTESRHIQRYTITFRRIL